MTLQGRGQNYDESREGTPARRKVVAEGGTDRESRVYDHTYCTCTASAEGVLRQVLGPGHLHGWAFPLGREPSGRYAPHIIHLAFVVHGLPSACIGEPPHAVRLQNALDTACTISSSEYNFEGSDRWGEKRIHAIVALYSVKM